jgi:chemotaxis protein methyltransferase CheR
MEMTARAIDILPENYRFLQESVYSHVGIVLGESKQYLLEGRLAPLIMQLGLRSINELCGLLHRADSAEIGHMVAEAMTTNETYFFREPIHFDAIRTVLLPKLRVERSDSRRLRFWSAASSSGQEAYSLAMLLLEAGLGDWNAQVFGTDFCSKVVERANAGLYQQLEVNRGLPATLLVKYFQRCGLNWQIRDAVRAMARFETIDLRNSMRTLGPFDLVLCRNVMIYFDSATKREIMMQIHNTMFRGGWLLLGSAETTIDLDGLFERRSLGGTTVYVAL